MDTCGYVEMDSCCGNPRCRLSETASARSRVSSVIICGYQGSTLLHAPSYSDHTGWERRGQGSQRIRDAVSCGSQGGDRRSRVHPQGCNWDVPDISKTFCLIDMVCQTSRYNARAYLVRLFVMYPSCLSNWGNVCPHQNLSSCNANEWSRASFAVRCCVVPGLMGGCLWTIYDRTSRPDSASPDE